MDNRQLFSEEKKPETGSTRQIQQNLLAPSNDFIKFLLADYDGCALTPSIQFFPNYHPDLLSTPLIKFAQEQHFQGFYGCTHRCVLTDFNNTLHWERVLTCQLRLRPITTTKQRSFNAKSLLTTSITQNLEKATGIPCIAVSTPDDNSKTAPKNRPLEICGYGYKNLIIPYEKKLIELNKHLLKDKINHGPYLGYNLVYSDNRLQLFGEHLPLLEEYDSHTKIPQLLQIAEHASLSHSLKKIELVYVDDLEELCKNALTINPNLLPKNIILHVYQLHSGLEQPKKIGTVEGTNPKIILHNIARSHHFQSDLKAELDKAKISQNYDTVIALAYQKKELELLKLIAASELITKSHLQKKLLEAAQAGNAVQIKILLEIRKIKYYDLDAVDDTGSSAFNICAEKHRLDLCSLLKTAGADVTTAPPLPLQEIKEEPREEKHKSCVIM